MTRFSMMSALRRRRPYTNSDDNAAKTYAVGFLNRFRLFAIVLCRPNDEEFIEYISTNFDDLDIITGKNLLFFSLVQPGITTDASKLIFSAEEALRDSEKYHVDEDLYLHVLTQALKVPLSDFPSILITDSLDSNSWYVVHTSIQHIYGDLAILTLLANSHLIKGNMIEEFLDRIIRLSGRYWYQVDSKIPLCEILAIVESSAATHSDNPAKSAKAQQTLREVEYRLSNYNMSEEARELIAWTHILCKDNRVSYNYSNANVARLLSIPPEYLEQDSIYFRDVYDKILHMYDIHNLEDHSVLCSLTHKIFESEIKASILQLMRYYRGIPMPDYYNKWYDKGGAYIVWTPKEVRLNKCQKGNPTKYISPTLGETRFVFKTLGEENGWRELCSRFGFTKEELDEFANLWEKIGLIRNDESHCNRMYLQDYENLTESVNMVLNHFFARMVMIKRDLNQ